MIGGISPWFGAAEYSNLTPKAKATRTGQNEFQNFLNTDKIEISKEAKKLKEARALIKEVGFVEFAKITRAVNQIQRALTRAMEDFPAHKKDIQAMMDSYENKMPCSVSEAFGRLHGMLKDSKLPQEVIDTIMRYIEEETGKTGTFVHNVHSHSRNTYSQAMHVVHERYLMKDYFNNTGD